MKAQMIYSMSFVFLATDAIKVKKTDLPVIPQSVQDILPSLDDEADDTQDDDDEDDIDDDEDMMADEAADVDDDDYDSNEDDEDKAQDDDDSWDRPSTVQAKVTPQLDATSTSSPSTTQKVTQRTATSSSSAAIDPYFTHFDPRAEHQSYKVKVRHFRYARGVQRRVNDCSSCLGCSTAA